MKTLVTAYASREPGRGRDKVSLGTSKITVSPAPRRAMLWMMIIGPGVLGLIADNDAGGMISYLVTGAAHHLAWFALGLIGMGPITFMIQEVSLRIAIATQMPYNRVVRIKFGSRWTVVNGTLVHLLNGLTLVTEFLGMTSALNLVGIPWWAGLLISYAMVLAFTTNRDYLNLERLLLLMAVFNLVFIPVPFLMHPTWQTWHTAWGGHFTPSVLFLLLSLAGNAIAPWMIYWQENAAWAGNITSLAAGRKDLSLGIVAQIVMGSIVMLIGGLTTGSTRAAALNPLVWLLDTTGKLPGGLFALGIFDAGFLAACTVSLSSAWMLSNALHDTSPLSTVLPTRGRYRRIHVLTITGAALGALWRPLPIGYVTLWIQALGALWMPVNIVMLIVIARDSHLMGSLMIERGKLCALIGVTVLFLFLAIVSWIS